MKQAHTDGLSVLGMGAAACVACCAGPILAFLGGLSLAGLASALLIGTAGLVIAAAALAALLVARRRRNSCPVSDDSRTPVAAPTRRPTDSHGAPNELDPALRRHCTDRLHSRQQRSPGAHRTGRTNASSTRSHRPHRARPTAPLPERTGPRGRRTPLRRRRKTLLPVLGLRHPHDAGSRSRSGGTAHPRSPTSSTGCTHISSATRPSPPSPASCNATEPALG